MCSKNQLQRKLALPRRIARADGPEGGTGRLRVRYPEVRVVQNVEELRPELHPGLIADAEVLVDGKVPLVELGSSERIAADIAVRRAGRRRGECVTGEIGVQHGGAALARGAARSEEHTAEIQSLRHIVCRI